MTRVLTIDPADPDRALIRDAARVLQQGGLVAFPTETVYGLGAHALDAEAVGRIFETKGRPPTDPVIVHLAHAEHLATVARNVPDSAHALAARFWPGALTLVLEKTPQVPDVVTAGLGTVGVRVPSHPVAHMLLVEAGVPVAAPSANRFSRPSPTTAEHVLADLSGVDVVIDGGATSIGVESTIVDLTVRPPRLRRPGGVTLEQLREVLREVESVHEMLGASVAQLAPGQLLRHYAPRATLTLYIGQLESVTTRMSNDIRTAVASGLRVGVIAPKEDLLALAPRLAAIASSDRVITMPCGSRRDRAEAARELFGTLRALDARGVDVLYASAPGGTGLDPAIIDRLTRAAEGRVIRCT